MQLNRPMAQSSILADDHTMGSDPRGIEREEDFDKPEEVDHERVVRWNLAAMMEEDAEAAEKFEWS